MNPPRRMTIPEVTDAQLVDDIDVDVPELENIEFECGDNVVYPHHGAGKVLKKELRKMFGEEREYLTIKILHNDMTVMVPCENAGKAGLRRIIDEEAIKKVLAVLQDDVSEMSSDRTPRTFLTVSSSMMRRRPALPAFSQGTMTVMSLWRILIVRYSRCSPRISFCSFFRTLPAPWCG